MSIYPAFFLLSAIFTGKYLLYKINEVNACFLGALFLVVYLIGLGFLQYIHHKNTIIALAILFNIFGGIGNGINSVATIAVLSSYK